MEKVFEIYIKTTPERLWEAITDPEMRRQVQLRRRASNPTGRRARATGRPPARRRSARARTSRSIPPRRLVQSFNALWSDDVKPEGTSRVTWEIEPVGDSCRLTVTHDQLREDANGEIYGGWPKILSGLKTLLETGETLTTPGSLRYAQGPSRRLSHRRRTRSGRRCILAASRSEVVPWLGAEQGLPSRLVLGADRPHDPDLKLVQLARRGCVRYR